MLANMASGGRRSDFGRQHARAIQIAAGREIRIARRAAGLSLRAAGDAVAMSPSAFGRIERGVDQNLSVERLCLACAAVGLVFNGRTFLDGDPVRDAGHLRLLRRLRALLPPGTSLKIEVPIPGGRRALDAEATLLGRRVGFELETRLDDVQALVRKLQLKKTDARLDVLVVVVAETYQNRTAIAGHGDVLRLAFPTPARVAMAALRRGDAPPSDSLIVV